MSHRPADDASSQDACLGLLDELPVPVWRADRDGRCNYVNRAWLEFTGRDRDQEIGYGWAESVHPDDVEECVRRSRAAFASGVSAELEYRFRRHDGQYRWVLALARPLKTPGGTVTGYICTCFDFTAK